MTKFIVGWEADSQGEEYVIEADTLEDAKEMILDRLRDNTSSWVESYSGEKAERLDLEEE